MAIKAKGNKRKIKREFLRKPKKDFGKIDYADWLLITNFRNHLYNENDRLTKEYPNITPLKIIFMIWAYGYDFFSKKGALENFRAGFDFLKDGIPYLKKQGLIEQYSPKQLVEEDVDKGTYISVEEVYLPERMHLSTKGKGLVERFFTGLRKVKADEYKTRIDRVKP